MHREKNSGTLRLLSATAALACVAIFGCRTLSASIIPIPNGDFASPDASEMPFFSFPAPIPGWQGTPQTTGVFYNSPTVQVQVDPGPPPVFGTFPNPLYITNMTSTQAGYLYAVPGTEMHQELAATFLVGQAYHLDFGLIASDETIPFVGATPIGAPIQLQLYYLDGLSNKISVGSTTITNNGPAIVNQTFLDMHFLDIPTVQANDPWAGKNIGIQVIVPNNSPALGGVWDVANLSLTQAPEPASLALLACGTLALTLRRRRPVH